MKKIICMSLWIAALILLGSDYQLPLTGWQLYYAKSAKLEQGIFTGIPTDAGAALVLNFAEPPSLSQFNSFRLCAEGLEADDLSLSLRGGKQVQAKAEDTPRSGEFVFRSDRIPEGLKQIRIYYNSAKRYSGKSIMFKLNKLEFFRNTLSAEQQLEALPMPERQRVFQRTMIYPRIQSKYDLMKNYLGGYSMGSGTFIDRPLFFDRSLAESPLPLYDKLNSPKGFCRQLQSALDFADGFAIFGSTRAPRYLLPVKYAAEGGFHNVIFMECTPPGLKDFEKISQQIDISLESPAVFKHQGKLVIGSYHGEVFSPEEWQKILAPYREKYGDRVLFMCELRSFAYRINAEYNKNGGKFSPARVEEFKKYARSYLEVVDGINFSGSNHLIARKKGFPEYVFNAEAYERFIVPIFASVTAEEKFRGKKLLGLSAHKVYAQVRRTSSNIDEEGTRALRRSLSISLAANPDYILMPEWNEVNENTHVEPVVSDAQTNRRVINAIRGIPTPDTERRYPNLILSFRQENDYAAPIPIELLSLPNPDDTPLSVTLRLLSPDEKVLKSYPKAVFSHRTIEEVFHLEPAGQFAAYRYLIPELLIEKDGRNMVVRRGLPHIRLTSAPNFLHRYVKLPLRDLPDPEKITAKFQCNDGQISVSGRVETPEFLSTVELLADDIPLAAVDSRHEYAAPEGFVLLCWRRQTPVVTGLSGDTVRITALQGQIRIREPHQYSLAGMATPRQDGNTLSGSIGGGSGVREFFFFATPNAVLEIGERMEKVSVKVADVLKNRRFRKTGPQGVSWLLLSPTELPELPFPLDVSKLDYRLSAPLSDRPNAVYTLRAVTREGRVFRSEPFMPHLPGGSEVTLPVWDLLDETPKTLRLPRELARNVIFEFNPRLGDLLPANNGCRDFAGTLGGFDYRTHSAAGWDSLYAPAWRQEGARWVLDFKRGSGITLGQPLFSRSAFEIELEASFREVSEQTLLDVIDHLMPVQVTNGKLHGFMTTKQGKFTWEADTTLEPNQFYNIKVNYDLKRLKVAVDGKTVADIPASGIFKDGWILGVGGVPVNTKKPVANVLSVTESATDTPNEGFNFQGTLRKLRIANYCGNP